MAAGVTRKRALETPMPQKALDPRFVKVAAAFAGRPGVSWEGSKGFGSGALKANGKIFAMMSSKDEFVVKLPKARVDEITGAGDGVRFDPGHGRLMKEWVVIETSEASWINKAMEAWEFVSGGKRSR